VELYELLKDENVITFVLLLIKFTIILGLFPFYDFQTITVSIKAPFAFYLAVVFFPITPKYNLDIEITTLIMVVLAEVLSGFIMALVLKIVFDTIIYVSELISMIMGLSAAAMFDPLTQSQSTVVGQIFSLAVIMTFLSFDGHHLILMLASEWITKVPFGTYLFNSDVFTFISKDVTNLFIYGFSIAFPVIAVGLFADIAFGMLMKTMPQFNIFVIGLPIKVGLGMITIIVVFSSMLFVFKEVFFKAYNSLFVFF
jgi:flagellar biosynthetic protein FliR